MEFLKQIAEREDLSEVLQKLGNIAAEVLDCGSLRSVHRTFLVRRLQWYVSSSIAVHGRDVQMNDAVSYALGLVLGLRSRL